MLLHLIVAALAFQTNADPRLVGASREEKAGWVQLHLKGSPNQIGFQYGYLLAPEIDDASKMMHSYLKWESQKDWKFFRDLSMKLYWPKVDAEYKQELLGLAEGLRARGYHYDSNDMLVLNSWIDLDWYYLPYLKDKASGGKADAKAPAQCSAFVATGSYTTDGLPVMGHSCWIDYEIGTHYNILLDVSPEKGNRFLMDTFPGFIHSGDDFAINSAGVMVTETTIIAFKGFDEKGVPEFVRARRAVQYSNNLNDFNRIMTTGNNGGYANTWLVADTKTGEIGELELGLKNVTFKRTTDGAFVGSNSPQDPNLIAEECDPKQAGAKFCADRRTRWEQLMALNKGKIDDQMGMKMLADHYDVETKTDGPRSNTICGHFEDETRKDVAAPMFPHSATGAVQAKVVTASMAKKMSFWARMGHPCGTPFIAKDLLAVNPYYKDQAQFFRDLPTQPWTVFSAH